MLITALLLLQTGLTPVPAREEAPPNIVLIVIDDLGWKDLGCYGQEFFETPRIDRLAAQGVRFTNGYSNGPNCAPSRASLLTGRATPRHGVFTVNSASRGLATQRKLLVPENRTTLPDEEWTLAEALAQEGYRSTAIGKWHLGPSPLTQGFELAVAGDERGHPPSYFSPYRNPRLTDGPRGEHLTARLTSEAIQFIKLCQYRGNRFFLYLSYFAVHTPIQGRPDLVAKYEAKRGASDARLPRPAYAAMVEAVDEGVGRVLDVLELLKLSDSTLVVLLSDNGGHAVWTDLAPLRGSKGMLYEGGVRVPMMARWPGRVAAGITCDTPVQGSDWFPTLLELAGVTPAEDLELDGRSLVPLLRGEATLEQRSLYWHFPAYLGPYAGRSEPWRTTPAGAIRSGRYKLLEFFEDGHQELYDLEADLGERHDLSATRPELRARLAAELAAWRTSVGAVVPSEPNPEYTEGP